MSFKFRWTYIKLSFVIYPFFSTSFSLLHKISFSCRLSFAKARVCFPVKRLASAARLSAPQFLKSL